MWALTLNGYPQSQSMYIHNSVTVNTQIPSTLRWRNLKHNHHCTLIGKRQHRAQKYKIRNSRLAFLLPVRILDNIINVHWHQLKWWWLSGRITLKTPFRLFHLMKEWLMFSFIQYCLHLSIFTKLDSEFYFSPTFTANFFLGKPETKMINVWNTWHLPPLSNVIAWLFQLLCLVILMLLCFFGTLLANT